MSHAWGGISWEDEVAAAIDADVDPELTELDDEALERAVHRGAAEVAATTHRWLVLLAELVRRGIWADQGAKSPAHWLSWAIGMGASTAREHVRVALRLRDFPRLSEAFAKGELSYTKARAITRLAVPELEDLLLRFARHATGAQLEQIIAGFTATRTARALEEDDPDPRLGAHWRYTEDGLVELRLVLEPVAGTELRTKIAQLGAESHRRALERHRAAERELVARGIEVAEDELPPVGTLTDHATQVVVESLRGASAEPADIAGDERYLLAVHTNDVDLFDELRTASAGDASMNTGELGAEAARHEDGSHDVATVYPLPSARMSEAEPPGRAHRSADRSIAVRMPGTGARLPVMSARVLRRLACDARLTVHVDDHDGCTAAVSGSTRKVPRRLRRLLWMRDRHCRFPGCDAARSLHAHHIIHWIDGGLTIEANLVLLCAFHHGFVHSADWEIAHDGAGHFAFRPPRGAPVPHARPAAPVAALDPLALVDRSDGRGAPQPVAPLKADWDGRRPDYHACVAALEDELERLRPPEHDVVPALPRDPDRAA
jgi:hypothetical protein